MADTFLEEQVGRIHGTIVVAKTASFHEWTRFSNGLGRRIMYRPEVPWRVSDNVSASGNRPRTEHVHETMLLHFHTLVMESVSASGVEDHSRRGGDIGLLVRHGLNCSMETLPQEKTKVYATTQIAVEDGSKRTGR